MFINIDWTWIQCFHTGSMSNWCWSEGLCYLGVINRSPTCFHETAPYVFRKPPSLLPPAYWPRPWCGAWSYINISWIWNFYCQEKMDVSLQSVTPMCFQWWMCPCFNPLTFGSQLEIIILLRPIGFNTLRPRQTGWNFADNIFQHIFREWKCRDIN